MSGDRSGDGNAEEHLAQLSPEVAKRVLWSLMFPGMLMPLVSSMSRVALPIIRDDFGLQAEMTAWVAVAFSLPFMVFMPIYGRLSDGLEKRKLILLGIAFFCVGTAMTLLSGNLAILMVGRAIQGFGVAGMMPLSMALISTVFQAHERGKVLGTWSSVGPTSGFIGSLVAGFLVAAWGWRGAFAPPLLLGVVAFAVVARGIPKDPNARVSRFLRTFDWGGVVLLALTLICLTVFLSSRSITGVAPLHDWRLLSATVILFVGFYFWEKKRPNPFVALGIFSNGMFCRATFCASMRMVCMGCLTFLIPLYLVDVHALSPAQLGGMLIINSGAMAVVVRFGGGLADRWSSRWLVVAGLAIQALVMFIFSRLPAGVPIWGVVVTLAFHGFGAGFMLAALHRAMMEAVAANEMGAATGLYSMFRFIGAVVGTAMSGVILQQYIDGAFSMVTAYQGVFQFFIGFPVAGVVVALGLRESKS